MVFSKQPGAWPGGPGRGITQSTAVGEVGGYEGRPAPRAPASGGGVQAALEAGHEEETTSHHPHAASANHAACVSGYPKTEYAEGGEGANAAPPST